MTIFLGTTRAPKLRLGAVPSPWASGPVPHGCTPNFGKEFENVADGRRNGGARLVTENGFRRPRLTLRAKQFSLSLRTPVAGGRARLA